LIRFAKQFLITLPNRLNSLKNFNFEGAFLRLIWNETLLEPHSTNNSEVLTLFLSYLLPKRFFIANFKKLGTPVQKKKFFVIVFYKKKIN